MLGERLRRVGTEHLHNTAFGVGKACRIYDTHFNAIRILQKAYIHK